MPNHEQLTDARQPVSPEEQAQEAREMSVLSENDSREQAMIDEAKAFMHQRFPGKQGRDLGFTDAVRVLAKLPSCQGATLGTDRPRVARGEDAA
jgi:hypothetical protein